MLAIYLWMVGSSKIQLCSEIYKKKFLEIGSKFCISLWNYFLWKSMQFEIFFHKNIFNGIFVICRFYWLKMCFFENLSTRTVMEWCCFIVIGKPIIKSMEIISHFHSRIGEGCNKLARCWWSAFTCWHFMHLEIYSAMSLLIPGKKYCFLVVAIVLWYLGWVAIVLCFYK